VCLSGWVLGYLLSEALSLSLSLCLNAETKTPPLDFVSPRHRTPSGKGPIPSLKLLPFSLIELPRKQLRRRQTYPSSEGSLPQMWSGGPNNANLPRAKSVDLFYFRARASLSLRIVFAISATFVILKVVEA
jgi:hypothetical protein